MSGDDAHTGKVEYPDDVESGWPDNDEEVPYDESELDAWKGPYLDDRDEE